MPSVLRSHLVCLRSLLQLVCFRCCGQCQTLFSNYCLPWVNVNYSDSTCCFSIFPENKRRHYDFASDVSFVIKRGFRVFNGFRDDENFPIIFYFGCQNSQVSSPKWPRQFIGLRNIENLIFRKKQTW
jgi:hypothetical protein